MAGPAYFSGVINMAKNADWVVQFTMSVPDPEDEQATIPLDLTGSTIMMEIRVREKDNHAIVSVSSPSDGITIDDAEEGQFTISISRERMRPLSAGDYVSDIVRVMPSGLRERLWEGSVVVVEGTTR